MTDTQPRTPAGSPAGGQFGNKPSGAESITTLAAAPSFKAYHLDGNLCDHALTSAGCDKAHMFGRQGGTEMIAPLSVQQEIGAFFLDLLDTDSDTAAIRERHADLIEAWHALYKAMAPPPAPRFSPQHSAGSPVGPEDGEQMEERRLNRLRYAAGSTTTRPELLDQLASEGDKNISRALAFNRSTPLRVRRKLAADPDRDVRDAVAVSVHTPTDLLATLASDPDDHVRASVAGNENTDSSVVAKLVWDDVHMVRQAAEANMPRVPLL